MDPLIGGDGSITRVVTSHDPAAAMAEADLVLGLREGRTAFLGEPGAVTERQLKELYG